jgi:tripartite-type tricarboxylate transporter receptor subunit TctC
MAVTRTTLICAAGALAVGLSLSLDAGGQVYPAKPVRVIVPFAPGGGSDIAARLAAQKLAQYLGQPFVIENRPGAGGLVGTRVLVESFPDGYTIMISTSSWVTSAAVHKPPFDPINNVSPIAEIGYNPFALAVHPLLPVKTTKEFVALARKRPGELAYGHPGVGSITHMATALLVQMAKIDMLAVPYKSGGAVLPDVLAGRIQVALSGLVNVLPLAETGKLRVLGVSSLKRESALPDVPTLAEAVPGYEVRSWFGAVAPLATPAPTVQRLNAALNKAVQDAEMKKSADAQGMTLSGGTIAEFNHTVRRDYERWSNLVKAAGIKPD